MLKAKYKCGSSLFLPNPRDIDTIAYYDTREECIDGKNQDFKTLVARVDNALKVRLGCYAYPFMKLVEGEEIEGLKTFSIFNEKVKEQYIALLKRYVSWLPHESKWWYHIFIAVKMYEKGRMSLTKAEKKIAQKIHDKGVDDTNYQFIIDYLNK